MLELEDELDELEVELLELELELEDEELELEDVLDELEVELDDVVVLVLVDVLEVVDPLVVVVGTMSVGKHPSHSGITGTVVGAGNTATWQSGATPPIS